MRQLLRNNALFIGLSLLLLAVLGLALLYIPKGDLHLLLCDRHAHARDIFYRYYTHVAEWFPYVVCVGLLLFGRVGNGLLASSCMVFSALTTQLFKHIINAPRPITWFAANMPDIQLPLVEGVRMNEWYSFPSGHTTSFFALAFVICILLTRQLGLSRIPRIIVQLLLFALAILGGYSRIYLSQHFAMDVFGGVVVGLSISILCFAIFYRSMSQKWYNYRLFSKK
jgi:membrane-associated phospholipid phosphatase